jgi:hypothetical protein
MSNTHCRHGHPWNEANTRLNNRGDRYCIVCARVQCEAYRRRQGKEPRTTSSHEMVATLTHCRHGHLWSETLRFNYRGDRFCVACRRESDLRRRREGPRRGPKKQQCPHGHPMVEGNIGWGNGWVCLTCKRECDRRTQKPVTHEKLTRIFEALREGKTLTQCYGWKTGSYVGGKIVDSAALINFMKANPRIKKQIKKLALVNRRAIMQGVADRKRLIAAPALLQNDGADAYEAITRATARLWEGERGDVMSLMFVAIAERRLLPRDAAARMPEFLREHRRQFSKFGPLSLDAPLFGDSTITLGDTVTAGLWQ